MVAGKRAERWSAPGTIYPQDQAQRCSGRDPPFLERQPQKLMSDFDPLLTFAMTAKLRAIDVVCGEYAG